MIRRTFTVTDDGNLTPASSPFADDAHLISSMIPGPGRFHAPVLDIDCDHEYATTPTEGHAHLFLNVSMTWDQYVRLLTVMGEVGILEKGYVNASISAGASFVRTPWNPKGVGPDLPDSTHDRFAVLVAEANDAESHPEEWTRTVIPDPDNHQLFNQTEPF